MEKKYVIKNFEDGTYLQQDREGWGEDFTMCEFDSLELAVDMVALQPYGNFTIEIIYKKLKIMQKKQSSVEYLIMAIKTEQMNKAKCEVEWQSIFKKAKEKHKKEIINAVNNGCGSAMCYIDNSKEGEQYYNETFGGENE